MLDRQFRQSNVGTLAYVADAELTKIEKAILTFKTKINALIARKRIQCQVDSPARLLPDAVQKREDLIAVMYVSGWINKLKTK